MNKLTNVKTWLVISVFLLGCTWLNKPAFAGCTWNIETVDSTGYVGLYTSLALDDNDNPHISYYGNEDLKYAVFNGSSWDIETVDITLGGQTSIALDADGYPHISYNDTDSYTGNLGYAVFNGSSWDIETVDGTDSWDGYASLALDGNDSPHISYRRYGDLKYAVFNGSSWDIETVHSTGSGSDVYSTSLALDADGYPHISYYHKTGYNWGDLKYAAFNGSSWDIETVHSTVFRGGHTSIALDADGYPHISYYREDYYHNGYLTYAAFNGSSWDIETVDSTGSVGKYTSIALDGNENPHISYYGTNDLKYAAFNGSSWDIKTVDSTGSVGLYTSLVLDGNDNPHISYYDDTNDDLKYATAVCKRQVYYVDADANGANDGTSWADAFNYFQDGLAAAMYGDEIRVAEGVYKPDKDAAHPDGTGDREATFQLINGVAIYGGFPSGGGEWEDRDLNLFETILSGDLYGNDAQGLDSSDLANDPNRNENSYHVVTGSEIGPNAILDGFTIVAGQARSGSYPHNGGGGMGNFSNSNPQIVNCTFMNNVGSAGGGMYNQNSDPDITNCTFSGNAGTWSGGGMFNEHGSQPILTNCTFTGNSASRDGGGIYSYQSNLTLTNCTFTDNSASGGGGMFNWSSNLTVTGCTFSGNSGVLGGGMVNLSGNLTVTNCTFSGNSAERLGGGMINFSDNLTVTNCIFSGNSASLNGGGMYLFGDNLTLANCTFRGNSASDSGGGIYSHQSNLTLTNCILWGNNAPEGDEIALADSSTIDVDYCDVQGGQAGIYDDLSGNTINWGSGNIDTEPGFVDPGYWDLNNTPTDPNDDFWVDGNYRLQPDSPCIDVGDNSVVDANIPDLDGNPRIIDGDSDGEAIVDMGAYEALGPIEAEVHIVPRVINRNNRMKRVMAIMRLPEGIGKGDVVRESFELYAGELDGEPAGEPVGAIWQRVIGWGNMTRVFVLFDKGEVMNAVDAVEDVEDVDSVDLTVVGRLESGQYIQGSDTVRIVKPRRRRPNRLAGKRWRWKR